MSTSTTYTSVMKDGKMITTKTVTTKGPEVYKTKICSIFLLLLYPQGKTRTETFVEEHNDDKAGQTSADFFKLRIKDIREDEKLDKTEDFKGIEDGANEAQVFMIILP